MWAMFNTALDHNKNWNIMNNINFNYSNNVGYMALDQKSSSVKSTTKNSSFGDNLRLNYRNEFGEWSFDASVNGGFTFSHARNAIRESANLDTWNFNYGGSLQVTAPWGTSLSTDISQESRRGFEDESMNTNELIWNAQLSQTFLKNRALTLSVQWYDILKERSNISRAISAFSRTDSWSNAINSYLMVHVIYQLNLLGNSEMRREGWGGFGGPGGPGGPGGRGGRGGGGGGWGGPGGGRR